MIRHRSCGYLFVGTLLTATVAIVVLAAWRVFLPMWHEHQAVRCLITALRSKQFDALLDALEAVKKMDGGRIAVPALIEALKDDDDYVRYEAAALLGELGPEAAIDAVPALVHALKDDAASDMALAVLANIGVPAIPDIAISFQCEDVDSLTRAQLATLLCETAGTLLSKLLKHPDPDVRDLALETLERLNLEVHAPSGKQHQE